MKRSIYLKPHEALVTSVWSSVGRHFMKDLSFDPRGSLTSMGHARHIAPAWLAYVTAVGIAAFFLPERYDRSASAIFIVLVLMPVWVGVWFRIATWRERRRTREHQSAR